MALALTVGVLIGGGVFMMLRRGMVRLIIGFALLSHGVNLLIMATGGIDRRGEPLGASADPATTADPLPQAFVLTAIVIAFAITMYMLVLAVTGDEDDDTDLELTGREMETPDLMDDPADSPGTHGAAPEDPDPVGTRPERGPGRGGRA
ncbi:sodium:proton antiporter [Kocuria sp. CPCC 205263]|uniref:sodium:proton antiporter n=1 Tax=Kocuria sp. CPCC 205263 TaxID=3073555 RepID=UPI0034D48536